jgi:hypothetical protein
MQTSCFGFMQTLFFALLLQYKKVLGSCKPRVSLVLLQYKKVLGFIEAGKKEGATLLTGGKRPAVRCFAA